MEIRASGRHALYGRNVSTESADDWSPVPYEVDAVATVTFGRDKDGRWQHHLFFEKSNGTMTFEAGEVTNPALVKGLEILSLRDAPTLGI
jgi:hypothetical protein